MASQITPLALERLNIPEKHQSIAASALTPSTHASSAVRLEMALALPHAIQIAP